MGYIQVNIGRNVDNVPLNDSVWADFRERVALALVKAAAGTDCSADAFFSAMAAVETHIGTGTWDGVEEESAKISIYTERLATPKDLGLLRERLTYIRDMFRQDSVALILGSELI